MNDEPTTADMEPSPAVPDSRAVDEPSWGRYMALAEEALNAARSSHHRETSTCLVREAEGWAALANAVTNRELGQAHQMHAEAAEDAAAIAREILAVSREVLDVNRQALGRPTEEG